MIDQYGVDYKMLGISGAERLAPDRLTIFTWPDPHLSEKTIDVTVFDGYLKNTIANMVYTMLQNNGLGLAGPQVGFMQNVVIINKEFNGDYFPMVLINPKIEEISFKESFPMREGCLSVPGYFEDRERPSGVIVSYYNTKGKETIEEFRNQNAFVIQHEIDHLHGKVFVDHLSKLKLKRIIKKTLKKKH